MYRERKKIYSDHLTQYIKRLHDKLPRSKRKEFVCKVQQLTYKPFIYLTTVEIDNLKTKIEKEYNQL